MKRSALLLAFLLALLPAGCVTRRVLITSDPPGAMVYRNGQPIGPTPVEESFVYYGKYHYRLVIDGREPVDFYPDLVAPWYQWPGIDLVTENLLPFAFRDRQRLHFTIPPSQPIRHDAIRARAAELQAQGRLIGPPPGAQPRTRPARPQPGPPVTPGPAPSPEAP